jgi:two-component system sensor histidine kinase DesK
MTAVPLYERTLGWYRFDPSKPHDGAKRWRRGGGIWLVYLLSPLGAAWTNHQLAASIAGTVLLVAFVLAYLFLVPLGWDAEWSRRPSAAALRGLVTLLAISAAATAVIGAKALATLIFVCAAVLVMMPPRLAVTFSAIAAVATTVVPQFIPSWHVGGLDWNDGVSIALASVLIFSVTSLIRTNGELALAREQVAGLAAERERLRIARDLHDLLGHSLTTVTVKAALARRLLDSDPGRAKQELAEVERLARESLADTRNAVAGYREVRLASELATARTVLQAAGIEAELPRGVDEVPAELGGLFGWVVREGITNVVRHSRANRVRIQLDARSIEIVDDGRGCPDAGAGHGLTGLSERAAALGARMVAGPLEQASGFRLRVEMP